MRSAIQLLAHLSDLGVRVSAAGDELKIRAPRDVLTPELREQLGEHKQELLELLESQESEATVPLARVSREEPLVLSFGQERLRFLDQLIPNNASYNTPSAIRLGGELDRSALAQSLDGLAARHESLRTTFSDGADGPVQRIAPPAPVALAFEDLCGLPAAQRQAELESRLQRVAQEPFDLGAGPLFRVVLYRLGEQDHVLLLLFHHIVIDGWSLGVIHRELGQLYAAAREGRAPELPELPVQFADYAAWQRASLTGEVLDRHLEFWRKALAGWSALELPTDRPRPPVQRFRGARWRLTLPASLTSALEDVAREAEVTPFMLLLATFQSLLGRYSGQDDVVVGSPIAGRNRVELEGLVGFLVNTLVLRGDLSGDPSFRELLGRVKKATLAAYQHQELPFEVLVHELAPERDLSRNPLFQVLFTVQNAPADSVELPGLSVRSVEFEDSGSILDLSVVVWTGNEGLEIDFIYNTDLYEAATIRSLARAFTSVLEQVVEDPGRRLSELALLDPEAQREALELQRWTPAEPGPEGLLHGLFARQAARTPEALAVSQADAALTYGELADRAAALARHLRGRGVGPGTLVGVCLHRSPDMLIALLGILEAGGAYVPLDPTMPAERLRYVLEDTGAPLVLTESRCAAELPELGERLLRLDEPLPAEASLAPADPEGPRHPVGPGDLAYVIHTSGSTGRPKGVQLTHASVVNFMESMAREPGLGSDDVLLAVTTLTFDIAALELFLPLCVGARVEVAPREVVSDGRLLAQALSACGATAMQATPAMWQMLLQAGWRGDGRLKMLCGGEELPRSLARELLERGGELWNMYGPTETTIWSAVHRVRAEDLAEPTEGTPGGGAVTLGEPIAETRLLVLDERRRPVPPGVPGELHIAGAGLARGYLNRPELDAEKFVPSPWPELLPGRLYRTGDAVRIDAAGRLRFLGRIDNQIKLRGFRIEPGEIEAVLREHPSVRQAVVVVREDAPGDRRLVAYLVPRGEEAPAPGELREHLRRKVPDYMVPGAFVALDELPLSPAGKVDRRALPAPGGERNVVEEFIPPRSDFEAQIAEIWCEVLGVERVGVHDNFFDLGGHSMLVGIVRNRLIEAFGQELSITDYFQFPTVADFFEHPTIAELAQILQNTASSPAGFGADGEESTASRVPPIVPAARDRDLPLSFAQQRLWFLDQLGVGGAYNIPYACRISGELDPAVLEMAFRHLVRRHEALRTRFEVVAGQPVQRISDDVGVELRRFDLRGMPEEDSEGEIERLIRLESDSPFDLARGPLLRAGLVHLAEHEHLLIVIMHHIVQDGWSMDVFFRDLSKLFAACREGREPDLPELAIQYADFAVWQRGWMQSGALEDQLAYWREQLAGVEVLNMPTDRPRPATQTFAGAAHRFELEPELSQAILSLSRQKGLTPFMTVFAAFQALLQRYTGQDDIAVGSPIASRTRPEIEPLIGFFVNALVLRTNLSGDPTFEELLERVRGVALSAYRYQDLPFERLVDAVDPERDLAHSPLFQVAFAYNAPRSRMELSDLSVTPFPAPLTQARYDMEMFVTELQGHFACNIVYNTDLFDASTIARLGSHFRTLLASALSNPEARLSELALLKEGERRMLLEDWNRTDAEYPDDSCFHEMFEARAQEAPDALAVVFEEQRLTYAELDARANQLAHALRYMGVGPDVLVGLCVERSPEMLVGLLGTLKAGGAYVPLDPSYPFERLTFLFDDCGALVMLTQERLLSTLPAFEGRMLCLDRDWGEISAWPQEAPPLLTTPDNLAYAIYTSGSTGAPKGALLQHRGLCNLASALTREFELTCEDRVLQFSSLSFDASTLEVVMALPKGATLYLGSKDSLRPGPELFEFLRRHAIDTVLLPPTALANLPLGELPDLATITVGGEACSAELIARWAPGRRFYNLYGPTEATIMATMTLLEADGGPPHIGRPIRNVRIYVLDEHLQPVPVGVPGELHIAGVGLARGYLNRTELTAERFIQSPFRKDDRLYRTGDLVRYRADGNVEYLGRIDHQVKLRGFRIELGEVEATLDEHPAVRESLVIVREDVPGDRRLVAYVVPDPSEVRADGTEQGDWEHDHVDQWQTLYEQSYGEAETPEERLFNISAWDSSYTGEPIPTPQMRVWLEETVAGVLATQPRRVLELGCGLGLVLFRVAPHCEEYLGTDFSRAALDYVQRQLGEVELGDARVRLERRAADEFDDLPEGHFDTVVLNSVAQYFPSVEYLVAVLEKAALQVRTGGSIFVGDLRSLPLLSAFHTSVQLHRAEDGLALEDLRRRVRQQIDQDQELVVAPGLFEALRTRIPRLSGVRIEPKRGRYDNELSRFRYDVLLSLDGEVEGATRPPVTALDWRREGLDLEALAARLRDESPARLDLAAVPNRRTCCDACAAAQLEWPEAPATAAELAAAAAREAAGLGPIEPDDLRELAASLGYEARLSWAAGHPDGAFDAVLLLPGAELAAAAAAEPARAKPRALRPWGAYANLPLRGRVLRELVPRLREAVARELPAYMIPAAYLVLDAFPLTPNGKVDRRALPAPDALRAGLGDAYAAPSSAVEERLAQVWARVLGLDRVGANDDFFELGGDSILSIHVVAAAREVGVPFTAKDLFQHKTVAQLVRAIDLAPPAEAEQGPVTGELPATPIQAWFHGLELEQPQHFNQALVLEWPERLDRTALERALTALLEHHDALRLRVHRGDGGWRQELAPPGEAACLEEHDLAGLFEDQRRERVEAVGGRLQASLDLGAGPLLRAALLRGGEEHPDLVLIAIHHLAVDAVSWSILLEDLERGLGWDGIGSPPALPAKTTSVQAWARGLREAAGSLAIEQQAEAWLHLAWDEVRPLPVDSPGGSNTMGSSATLECGLSPETTEVLLQGLPAAFGAEMQDALLVALARAVGHWTGGRAVLVDLESHGREELVAGLDVSRTVGWFTAMYPLVLRPGLDRDPVAALKGAREARRALADRALAHGLVRHLSPNERLQSALADLPEAELSFNYLGRLEQTLGVPGRLRLSDLSAGPNRGPANRGAHLLEVNAAVVEGGLRVVWTYVREVHAEAALRSVTDRFVQELESLAKLCGSTGQEERRVDPGLADLGWAAEELDDIMNEIEKRS